MARRIQPAAGYGGVIMETGEFLLRARINAKVLDEWVEAGWLIPDQIDTGRRYSEVDLARAHLIRDLRDLGVNDEGIPVILDLIDQIYGIRRMMRGLLSTIKAQQQESGHI
jgi:chaperone modulatory protein CbpM